MTTLLTLAAEGEGPHLTMPPLAFGLTALVIFGLLLLLVWLFRHTAQAMIEGSPHGRGHGGAGAAGGHGGAHH